VGENEEKPPSVDILTDCVRGLTAESESPLGHPCGARTEFAGGFEKHNKRQEELLESGKEVLCQ